MLSNWLVDITIILQPPEVMKAITSEDFEQAARYVGQPRPRPRHFDDWPMKNGDFFHVHMGDQ